MSGGFGHAGGVSQYYAPFHERPAAVRHQVLGVYCMAGRVYETRLRFKVYEMPRGDEFRELVNWDS